MDNPPGLKFTRCFPLQARPAASTQQAVPLAPQPNREQFFGKRKVSALLRQQAPHQALPKLLHAV
jgi:hypothetical protein